MLVYAKDMAKAFSFTMRLLDGHRSVHEFSQEGGFVSVFIIAHAAAALPAAPLVICSGPILGGFFLVTGSLLLCGNVCFRDFDHPINVRFFLQCA